MAIAFLLVAGTDRLIVNPIRARFARVDQAIKISEKQLGHDLRNVHLKDQITGAFEKYVEYVERSGSDEEEVAKILGEIESLARQSNVYLVDVKPQAPQKVDFYKEYSVEIEAEGGITDLTTFLHHINMSNQLLRVERLRLNTKEEENKTLKSSMLITKVLVL
jgi:Tfp pilus assembly protein PilO